MVEVLETYSRNVERFKQIYEEDRYKARVYCFDADPHEKTVTYNNVSEGIFQIYDFTKKYGVSKTMKLYSRKKMNSKLIVNKTKFYIHNGKQLFPIMLRNIDRKYLPIFISHFSWVRFLEEYGIQDIPFNTIVRHKLYSRDKLLRYMYGCGGDLALQIKNVIGYSEWKNCRKSIINVENFNPELLKTRDFFIDTVSMAYKLNKVVNAAWSSRRLKEEHDNWSKEYTDIVFEFNNRPLSIHPIFLSLDEYLGGGLIRSTKGLAFEGSSQRHCVASYTGRVESGRVAIFNLKEYTAEIINSGRDLRLGQYNGYRNSLASHCLRQELEDKIKEFNKKCSQEEFDFKYFTPAKDNADLVDLPF